MPPFERDLHFASRLRIGPFDPHSLHGRRKIENRLQSRESFTKKEKTHQKTHHTSGLLRRQTHDPKIGADGEWWRTWKKAYYRAPPSGNVRHENTVKVQSSIRTAERNGVGRVLWRARVAFSVRSTVCTTRRVTNPNRWG